MIAITRILTTLSFLVVAFTAVGQDEQARKEKEFFDHAAKWFSAWTLVYNNIYQINTAPFVDFIFFDDEFVYSTSAITIPNGIPVKGPSLQNVKLTWRKQLHQDTIRVSNELVISPGLMCYSAEVRETNKYFLLMPLPSYWDMAGVSGKELGLENLITGAFIHELANLHQMQNHKAKLNGYERLNNFGIPFNEDIVQDLFEGDSSYNKLYVRERDYFFSCTHKRELDFTDLYEALNLMQQRHYRYFNKCYENLQEIDNFFLTIKGLNQFSTYLWLTHPAGGNLSHEIALSGVRRNKRWWSQDEGFALFLVLANLNEPNQWARNMFMQKDGDVIQQIKRSLK